MDTYEDTAQSDIDTEEAVVQKEVFKTYTVFNSEQFGKLRVVWRDGRYMFLMADACKSLEITNVGNALGRIDKSEKDIIEFYPNDNTEKPQFINAITLAGLCSLIYKSRKPNACDFLQYVQSNIFPLLNSSDIELKIGGDSPANDKIIYVDCSDGIQFFKNEKFGKLRYIIVNSRVLFIANDAAFALGYAKPRKAISDYCKNVNFLCPKNSSASTDARKNPGRTSVDATDKENGGAECPTDARKISGRTSVDATGMEGSSENSAKSEVASSTDTPCTNVDPVGSNVMESGTDGSVATFVQTHGEQIPASRLIGLRVIPMSDLINLIRHSRLPEARAFMDYCVENIITPWLIPTATKPASIPTPEPIPEPAPEPAPKKTLRLTQKEINKGWSLIEKFSKTKKEEDLECLLNYDIYIQNTKNVSVLALANIDVDKLKISCISFKKKSSFSSISIQTILMNIKDLLASDRRGHLKFVYSGLCETGRTCYDELLLRLAPVIFTRYQLGNLLESIGFRRMKTKVGTCLVIETEKFRKLLAAKSD